VPTRARPSPRIATGMQHQRTHSFVTFFARSSLPSLIDAMLHTR
jgi:hypothetical protein